MTWSGRSLDDASLLAAYSGPEATGMNGDVLDVFEKSVVRPEMKLRGFKKIGRVYANVALNPVGIELQRSRDNSASNLKLAFNGTVVSRRLAAFRMEDPVILIRRSDGHYCRRFSPPGSVEWWTVNGTTDVAKETGRILDWMRSDVIPEVLQFQSDEGLRDLWLSGQFPGLTLFQGLMQLSVLVKSLGPQEAMGDVLARLKAEGVAKRLEGPVESHLERLASWQG